jgi:hypothetical protein
MGIIITCDSSVESSPPFKPVVITLECDQHSAFFCRGIAEFRSPDGFIGCHRDAMKAGWLERYASEGRLWICPECSGK